MKKILVISACLLAFSSSAQATDIAIGGKAGTLGLGAEITANIVPMMLNGRIQLNGFNYDTSITDTAVTYDAKFKLFSFGAIADFYPLAGKFRLSGGLYYADNKLDMVARPTAAGSFNFNGTTYTTAQLGTVNTSVKFNNFTPYLGIGWGDAVSSGSPLGFNFEVGALYQGSPKTVITSASSVPGLAADLAAEKRRLDDSLSSMKFWPVVSAGITWRF